MVGSGFGRRKSEIVILTYCYYYVQTNCCLRAKAILSGVLQLPDETKISASGTTVGCGSVTQLQYLPLALKFVYTEQTKELRVLDFHHHLLSCLLPSGNITPLPRISHLRLVAPTGDSGVCLSVAVIKKIWGNGGNL